MRLSSRRIYCKVGVVSQSCKGVVCIASPSGLMILPISCSLIFSLPRDNVIVHLTLAHICGMGRCWPLLVVDEVVPWSCGIA